jgi:hypothetical protein
MIGEALAIAAFYRSDGAIRVVVSKRDAIVITEVEFGKITMQMLFAAMLVHATHAAFENARCFGKRYVSCTYMLCVYMCPFRDIAGNTQNCSDIEKKSLGSAVSWGRASRAD